MFDLPLPIHPTAYARGVPPHFPSGDTDPSHPFALTLSRRTPADLMSGRAALLVLARFVTLAEAMQGAIDHARELAEKQLARIDTNHFGMQLADKHVHDHVAFIEAQQAVVHKHAGQLIANGAVNQRSGHGRIHTTRQAQNHLLVAHLLADQGHGFRHVVAHDPIGHDLADTEHKTLKNRLALLRVRHLGMKLDGVKVPRLVGHSGNGATVGRGHQLEARWQLDHLCLLYTSPSPRDGLLSRMPTSA